MTTLTINTTELETKFGSVWDCEEDRQIFLTRTPRLYITSAMRFDYETNAGSYEKPTFECEGVDEDGKRYFVDFGIADYITPDFSEYTIEKM